MIARLFRRKAPETSIEVLYGAIVAQARQPWFYAALGVPDTVEGRFDMIVLHLALITRRLRTGGPEAGDAAQRLFDHFCRDLDHNLREMGVSDIAVPRKMQRLGEAFYGRAMVYDRALDDRGAESLAEALNRNVYGRSGSLEDDGPARLAAYARRCEDMLAEREALAITSGVVTFPPATDGSA